MANKLAQLADLKTAINANTTGIDAELTQYLQDASGLFERIAGVAAGSMRRQVDRVEFPSSPRGEWSRGLHLTARPIESVSEVVQLYSTGTDDEFASAVVNNIGVLDENEHYMIDSRDMGRLLRLDGQWTIGPRYLRVTYTAGWADPDDALGGTSIEPPDHVQRAVLVQAVQLFNTRKTAGLTSVNSGKGGEADVEPAGIHPLLREAAEGYRRMLL